MTREERSEKANKLLEREEGDDAAVTELLVAATYIPDLKTTAVIALLIIGFYVHYAVIDHCPVQVCCYTLIKHPIGTS